MISIPGPPGPRLYFQNKAQMIEYTKNKEEEAKYLTRLHPKCLEHDPETRRLVKEEVEYIMRIYRKEKPDIEGLKEILSRSGYHYTTGLPTTIHDAPDLAAFKDINESSVVILVWLRSKVLKICCRRMDSEDCGLPFHYNNKIARISNAIRKTLEYKMWRNAIMQRDGNKCRNCGLGLKKLYDLKIKLNVHHFAPLDYIIKAFEIATLEEAIRDYKPELFDLKNGITCCEVCHRRYFHPNGTKSNKNLL